MSGNRRECTGKLDRFHIRTSRACKDRPSVYKFARIFRTCTDKQAVPLVLNQQKDAIIFYNLNNLEPQQGIQLKVYPIHVLRAERDRSYGRSEDVSSD